MIYEQDVFARLAIFPKFIDPATQVFDLAFLLRFSPVDQSGGVAMSVGSRLDLKTDALVHAFGCRSAANADREFEIRKGTPPDPETEANRYLGFYDFEWGAAASAPVIHHHVAIRFKKEHGEMAHFQIEMHPRSTEKLSKKQQRNDRIAVRTSLAMGLYGPSLHICEQDEALRPALEAIAADLPVCAKGREDSLIG